MQRVGCKGRWWIGRDDVPARDKCNEKSRVFIGHRERESRLERTSDEMKQREEGEERVARTKREREREKFAKK